MSCCLFTTIQFCTLYPCICKFHVRLTRRIEGKQGKVPSYNEGQEMKFTRNEIVSMEDTMRKLQGMADALLSRESTDAANVRYIVGLLAEIRVCATLMGATGATHRTTRLEGAERLTGLLAYNREA